MRLCIRCKANKPIKDELVCEECLEWLCVQHNVPNGQDPLEHRAIKALIVSYKEMNGEVKK